jgi:D-glucosaminate-6-phosphate ammonia-lyase
LEPACVVNHIPADLMASRIINAAGTLTRLSGARVSTAVAAAMSQAAQSSFDMWALQAAASVRIAQATGAEAGLVTTGASAGLTLAAAAAIAGFDVARMQALPFTGDVPNEILVPRTHRNGYDRAIAVAGAKLIDVGTADRQTDAGLRGLEAWEIETAISPKTVAILGNASGATEQDLPLLAEIAVRHHLPLIVDAAAQLPPISNLRAPLAVGASLVVYSGGKAIGGPQASGILAGRRDLIASAALQMLDMDVRPTAFVAPTAFFGNGQPSALPRHGIGRGFKASKEAIVGLMVALTEFIERDHGAWHAATHARLQRLQEQLASLSGISTEIIAGRREGALPRLAIDIKLAKRAEEVCRRLTERRPSVRLGEGQIEKGILIVDLLATDEIDDEQLGCALRDVFNALPSS